MLARLTSEQLMRPLYDDYTFLHFLMNPDYRGEVSPETLTAVLDRINPEQINPRQESGWRETPLGQAIRHNHVELALVLISRLSREQLTQPCGASPYFRNLRTGVEFLRVPLTFAMETSFHRRYSHIRFGNPLGTPPRTRVQKVKDFLDFRLDTRIVGALKEKLGNHFFENPL